MTSWSALEAIPGQLALPVTWRRLLRDDFPAFRTLCLQPSPEQPISFPCPLHRSCAQQITPRPDASQQSINPSSTNPCFLAVCELHPPNCNETPLTHADVTPL